MVQKITLQERELIFKLLCKKKSVSEIACRLNRHISSIYREIQRLAKGSYSPTEAHAQASIKS